MLQTNYLMLGRKIFDSKHLKVRRRALDASASAVAAPPCRLLLHSSGKMLIIL